MDTGSNKIINIKDFCVQYNIPKQRALAAGIINEKVDIIEEHEFIQYKLEMELKRKHTLPSGDTEYTTKRVCHDTLSFDGDTFHPINLSSSDPISDTAQTQVDTINTTINARDGFFLIPSTAGKTQFSAIYSEELKDSSPPISNFMLGQID